MHYSIALALWAGIAYGLFKVVAYIADQRRHARKAKELGCGAVGAINGGFLGLKNIFEVSAADRKGLLPDLLLERHRTGSKALGRVGTTSCVNMLGSTQYFTADPKNIQAMLATQFDDFHLGPARRGNMLPTLGDGIFVQDGEAWSHSRALLRPNFVRDQVGDLELEEAHIQHLLKVLPVQADGWTAETNLQQLFFRLTLDSACEFLFGESVDSQLTEAGLKTSHDGKGKDEHAFSINFDSAQKWLSQRFRVGNFYWLVTSFEFRKNNRVVNEFISHYVDLALQESSTKKEKKSESAEKERYVFLEALAQQTRDPVELRAQLLNILLAGRDTTASLLSWLFYLLVRHPEVFTKLRATILETFGTYEHPTNITFASLKGCQYLQHTINEVLRLHPVVPLNARRSKCDTTLPLGGGPDGKAPVYIPAGTDVGYSIFLMHRRLDLWGEDADEFRPERFVDRRPGWEFLPFNGGPRVCIGQQFALTEASYVTVRLLQRFDQLWAPPEALQRRTTTSLTLTSSPKDPVTLKLHVAPPA